MCASRLANSLRGKVAVIGVGETPYYKRGGSPDPEFVLTLKAILRACDDAGLDPRAIDSFASYGDDRNEPSRLAAALGIPQLRVANMVWGGGGGGAAAALGNAGAAILSGQAEVAVVYRGLAQGQFERYGAASAAPVVAGSDALTAPYGISTPAQRFALKVMRFMHDHGIEQSALRAIALASYHHAQANPRAVMYGRPLTADMYDGSRWIAEPFHLFDACQETDGAAALIVVTADRAKAYRRQPAYLLAVAQGANERSAARAFNAPDFASASFSPVVPHLWEMAQLGPQDVDVVQSYENFTGGVLMSLCEHGFVSPEESNDFFKLENLIAPAGALPLNTSGGNLAECYLQGLELQIEAVRQIRGQSTSQVPDAHVALVAAGPMVSPVSTLIFGSEATLA